MRVTRFLLTPLALLIALAALALPVGAQNPVHLSSMEISVWPEYDKPGALVIYRGTFSPAVPLPNRASPSFGSIDSINVCRTKASNCSYGPAGDRRAALFRRWTTASAGSNGMLGGVGPRVRPPPRASSKDPG